jgi:hypothetical protein
MNNKEKINPDPIKQRFFTTVKPINNNKEGENTNYWNYTLVEIFDKENDSNKIGEYIYNYPCKTQAKFYPFMNSDKEWFALYPDTYSSLAVMSLPDCKVIAKLENTCGNSLCTVDAYIPTFVHTSCSEEHWDEKHSKYWIENYPGYTYQKYLDEHCEYNEWDETESFEDEVVIDYFSGSVAITEACYWGGEYCMYALDLSQIKEGKLEYIKYLGDSFQKPVSTQTLVQFRLSKDKKIDLFYYCRLDESELYKLYGKSKRFSNKIIAEDCWWLKDFKEKLENELE